jgi:tRNA-dihydrouridine synthase
VVLKIGPLAVDPPVVLAPMAGVTNAAFRRLCRSYGAGLYVSEMVSARALCERNERTAGMVAFAPDEEIRSVQLYGVDPHWVGEAVRRVVDLGVHHIDLNSGCPSPKVTRRGGGGALPAHHVLFGNVVRAAVQAAGPVPVTVKMRKGIDDDNLTYLEAATAAADAGRYMSATTPNTRTNALISSRPRTALNTSRVTAVALRLVASVVRRPYRSVRNPPMGCESTEPAPQTVSTTPAVWMET